jgi:hypothetical protein
VIPLPLAGHHRQAYLNRLFGSHDFSVRAEVLDLNEKPQGTAVLLDGQINLHEATTIRRTASLTISDPEGAFDFSDPSGWSPRSMWADRLVRVRHILHLNDGTRVDPVCFVGPLATINRAGADVSVELQDKTALAVRGCPPMTVKKGHNAVDAIRTILRRRTGEFRFRFPHSKRRLSKPYSVGWDDDHSPWAVAQRIARRELGMQLLYTADGYALLRRRPRHVSLRGIPVTGTASMSADFTSMTNWARVTGHLFSKTKDLKNGGSITTTHQPQAIARIPAGRSLSPEKLGRKGVPRYWPELVEDDALRKMPAVKDRARDVLASSDQLQDAPAITCVPFFHGDADDLVHAQAPEGGVTVRLGDCSIPLGTGGDMTIGAHRWVSNPQGSRTRGRVLRTKKYQRPSKSERKENRRERRNDQKKGD